MSNGAEIVGTRVRNVLLVRRLGSGGMGEVYEGRDEALGRAVAVKVLRAGRRLDERARRRFLREARILARVEHPGICRVLDYVAGDDVDFLVLELVAGRTLRDAMAEGVDRTLAMSVAEQVAEALSAAHALSIVHRDLKPANIMLTDDGSVKILDFGLARTVDEAPGTGGVSEGAVALPGDPAEEAPPRSGDVEDAADDSLTVTRLGDVMGTPGAMSPEQARGEPVTAASDVYSFGVLLQELLTGGPVYGDDLAKEVLLRKAQWADTAPVRGVGRSTARLIREMTELDPTDRPAASEVLRRVRWIRDAPRRRIRRAAVALTAVALMAAAAVSTVGFVEARRAQRSAETSEAAAIQAQAEAEAVNTFLRSMLGSADPGRLGRDVRVVDVLDQALETVDADFTDQPVQKAAVLDTLGVTYRNLGELDTALETLDRVVELRTEHLGPSAAATLAGRTHRGEALMDVGRVDDAEAELRDTVTSCRSALGEDHERTLDASLSLARVLRRQRQFDEAEALARDVLARRRAASTVRVRDLVESNVVLGQVLASVSRWEEADQHLEAAVEQARRELGQAHPVTLSAMDMLSTSLSYQKRYEEAERIQREVYARRLDVLGPSHPATLTAQLDLAIHLVYQERVEEAIHMLRPLAGETERLLGPSHFVHIELLRTLSYALDLHGERDRALELMRRRWEICRVAHGDDHRVTLETKSGLASALAHGGEDAEAERLYREVLETRQRLLGEDHPATRRSVAALGKLLRRQGRNSEAEALEQAVGHRE